MIPEAKLQAMKDLRTRILRVTRMRPELGPTGVAAVVGCSHVTVRKVQREAGVYIPKGCARERYEPQH